MEAVLMIQKRVKSQATSRYLKPTKGKENQVSFWDAVKMHTKNRECRYTKTLLTWEEIVERKQIECGWYKDKADNAMASHL